MRFSTICSTFTLFVAAAGAEEPVEFNRDIRPILSDRCYYCHGPDEDERKADLRLDIAEGALRNLGGYAAVVPGDPDASELFHRIISHDEDEVMPPPSAKKPAVSPEEIQTFRKWIEQGANYQGHWAFEPIKDPAVPDIGEENPIDAFIRARLAREGVEPSARADKYTLIRRATLDLVGLLPTPEEVGNFATDDDPNAYDKLVDRLLASEHYGERWGRHWLDGARYADSNGYSVDSARTMWPYRDWVIKALNDDMPFDQFTTEQIAGDLIPGAPKSALVASAFHRNTLINEEGGSDPEQFRVEATMDRVNTTGAVWLGLTVSCAQCHTHKFDPIFHEEYYQLFSFFNTAADKNNTGPTVTVAEGELFQSTTVDPWQPLSIKTANTASDDAKLAPQPDGSLLLTGKPAPRESYQIVATSPLARTGALRIHTLTDSSLPKNGPGSAKNGNFVLTRIKVFLDGEKVVPNAARADRAQELYPAEAAIDGDPKTGWAINSKKDNGALTNAPHELVLTFEPPLETAGKDIEIRLFHDRNPDYLIGRFALGAAGVAPAPTTPKTTSGKPVKLMVMGETEKPRSTYLLTRGDFTRPDKERGKLAPGVIKAVTPALPAVGNPASRTRLDLASWLVSDKNPLTARVTVNRIWMRYFGRGIVETEEDFGTQGSLPTHPDLLDYLATRFIRDGWSMKSIHRLITTSATYQQSSRARPDLAGRDARNLLLARQSRIRLDAEIIRDAALCASGTITKKIGGPSVYPPQPDGIYSFTQKAKKWPTSTGPDRYRRAMYTFFYRSAPYPLFGTFDAPDFQATCTRRSRSNTPLQALNIANDPAFIELATEMAARLIEELPGDPGRQLKKRLDRAFALALSRAPSPEESKILLGYTKTATADFLADPRAASPLVSDRLAATKTPVAHAAALVAATRTLLNTDNFITRE